MTIKSFSDIITHMKISALVKITNACGNEQRLEILKLLRNKKYATVSSVSKSINLSVKSTSKHLQILHAAHIVKREREGVEIYYSLNRPLNDVVKVIIGIL